MSAWLRDLRHGITAHPLRSGMMFLAMAAAIASFTLLLCVLGGVQEKANGMVRELGADILAIVPTDAERLSTDHAKQLRASLPGAVVSAVRESTWSSPEGHTLHLLGADANLLRTRPWTLRKGRFLDPRDLAAGRPACVISQRLSERNHWRIGQAIPVGEHYFDVVGIVDPGGRAEGGLARAGIAHGEDLVIYPHTIAPYWSTAREQPESGFNVVYVKRPADRSMKQTLARCRAVLGGPLTDPSRFSTITPASLIAGLQRWQGTLRWSAGGVTALFLLLGGTTLMSLMVANVQKRVREIGLRLSLGASEWSIGFLFVAEAVVITLIAGLAASGITLWLVQHAGAAPVPLQASLRSFLVPVFVAVVTGACFAWWPARIAARIRPADALRSE